MAVEAAGGPWVVVDEIRIVLVSLKRQKIKSASTMRVMMKYIILYFRAW